MTSGRRDELADLATLRRAVHGEQPRPEGVVAAGLRDLRVQADVLERLRLARVDLRPSAGSCSSTTRRASSAVSTTIASMLCERSISATRSRGSAASAGADAEVARRRGHAGTRQAATPTPMPIARLARPIRVDLARSARRAASSRTCSTRPTGPKLNTPRDPNPAQKRSRACRYPDAAAVAGSATKRRVRPRSPGGEQGGHEGGRRRRARRGRRGGGWRSRPHRCCTRRVGRRSHPPSRAGQGR